jgi:hypothetical protein
MTCAEARHLILIADPAVLRDRSDAALREHLGRCAECAAAAGHVVSDLALLRSALIARGARVAPVAKPRRSTKRVAMTLVPMALAAELALFAFLSSKDTVNPLIDRRIIDDTVTTMLPVAAHNAVDTGEVTRAEVKVEKPRAVVVAQVDDSTADADSVAKSARVDAPPVLQVQPSARQQVAVIGTSNPKITVVWITKGDSL